MQSCTQNQTCQNNALPNISVNILEQDEEHTVTLVTYEVDNTIHEVTIIQTLLWSYSETNTKTNRTAKFISTEIVSEGVSLQFYSLSYIVQHEKYNLTIYTTLTPLDSDTYNSSFTVMNYAPAGKSELTSLEFVEFNSPVTLSQQYAVLGKVAEEIGKDYKKSGGKTLKQLAQGYHVMEKESKHLAKLVEKQLQEYDREILKSSAILMDLEWDYWGCVGGCILTWCLSNWLYCEICWTTCQVCFTIPSPATCGPCAACIDAPVAWCLVCCLVSPIC